MLLLKFVMLRYTLSGLISAKFQAAVSKGDISDSSGMHQVNFQEALHFYFSGLPPPVLCYLDGGDESSGDVRTEAGRHGELGNIFFFLHHCGDALLAE